MKFIMSLVLLSASLATSAFAGQLEYDLKVEGMKCAYCAYNVSKQLETLDGVVADSVDVDLERGRVTLRSDAELEETQMGELLLRSGFQLAAVTRSEAVASQNPQRSDRAVLLSITMMSDRIRDGDFDAVLQALGDIAAERSGRVTVVGPVELETAILKPVLAGRGTVIKVHYKRASKPDQTVAVSVSVNQHSSQ